ncbi:MAG: hypothetical protein ACXVB9_02580 [Bdellovibrionota bacterium]
MLKTTILSVFALLLSSAAFAMPTVGDQAVYDVTIVKDGQTYNATSVIELAQFDAAKNQFLERETQTMAGQQPQVTDTWKNASDLITDAKADQLLANCSAAGGVSATVNVPAGNFSTCVLPVQDDAGKPSGKVWISKVPFGVVHAEVDQDGVTAVVNLRTYTIK